MKKIIILCISMILMFALITGCVPTSQSQYTKFTNSFYDTFNTVVQVVGYTQTQKGFDTYYEKIHKRFQALHQLFDIYHDYTNMNNIKTINDNAGKQPIKVDKQIINLILFAKEWAQKTGGKTNIAMGAALSIWHDYRDEGLQNPSNAKLPSMADLQKAAQHMKMDDVIVDEAHQTVFLKDPLMRLDVGAVAKGYATEMVAKEMHALGFSSFLISSGGNVRTIGKPFDSTRTHWGVAIQDPDQINSSEEQKTLDTLFVQGTSVVSSGNYQRYYMVDGQMMHHLIDPATLMPCNHYKAVTVVTENSGIADFMSTTLFLLPFNESLSLANQLGVEALWVMQNGTIETTEKLKRMLKSHGANSTMTD